MNNIIEATAAEREAKSHATIAYALVVIGFFTAIPYLLGVIWAMIKKSSAIGSIYHSHYVNITRTFWWWLLWAVIGYLLTVVIVGFIILGIAWIWALYRYINGLVKITSDLAYPL